MDLVLTNNWRVRLYQFFTKRIVYHSIFWLIVLCLLIFLERYNTDWSWGFTVTNEIINVIFYALIVYFNLYYLIPNYLTKKRFLTYGILLILCAILFTPLRIIVFYFKFNEMPIQQGELRNAQFGYFIVSFVIAGASTIIKIIGDWGKQLREKQELQTQTMQSELRFLKSQINPHFLFNTLNNLYALTLKKDDKAPEIVIKLSEMMRYMLYECNERRVPLSKEVNYIRNYLDLEKLRQGKNVDIRFEVEGQLKEQQVAPLMFIPFLENSFKHGLNNHLTKGFVNIKMNIDNNKVDFFIENSKPDAPPIQSHRRSGGIGLVNVKRRLDLLYPNQYTLKIDDTPKSYAVTLQIDLDN